MIRIEKKQDCCGCQACVHACPKHCITMKPDEEGFLYPVIDENICIQCGLCERICPNLNTKPDTARAPEAYAAYCLDETLRSCSSSGGIFSLMAEKILEDEGCVYGAAMEGRYVCHVRVADRQELYRLRGSKYVQSDVGETYIQVRRDLDNGKPVLYAGTPCQIEGLQHFLGETPNGLICVDIICHGVSSAMVWDRYCDFREKKAKGRMVSVSFREKRDGWKQYAVNMKFCNGREYHCRHRDDPYMRVFLHDLSLRPSCYQCRFKKCGRNSDVTLADFWKAHLVCPEMDDDKGLSLVMTHSDKGRQLFSRLTQEMCLRSVEFHDAVRANPSMTASVAKPGNREQFLQEIRTNRFDKVSTRYAGRSRKGIRRLIGKFLHKKD